MNIVESILRHPVAAIMIIGATTFGVANVVTACKGTSVKKPE